LKPWIESYRPTTIDEIVGHDLLKDKFKQFLEEGNFPHVLLHGEAGVGKTAILKAFLKDFYGDTFAYNFVEFNSSVTNGIAWVREELPKLCSKQAKEPFSFKVFFLSEIDGMTPAAQFALRRPMEIYSNTVRFFADANHINKLIKPIRSRFIEYFVRNLNEDEILDFLNRIIQFEDLSANKDVLNYITKKCKGDLRTAVNQFQSVAHLPNITVAQLNELNPSPTPDKVYELISLNQNGSSFQVKEKLLQDIVKETAGKCDDILEIIYQYYLEDYEGDFKPQILLDIGEYLSRMATLHVPNIILLRSCLERIKQIEGV